MSQAVEPPAASNALRVAAEDLQAEIVEWRRHLHTYPELSGQEAETAAFVTQQLRNLGLEPQGRVGNTFGITADIQAGSGPAVALRADMDALPIDEENDVPYRSQRPGVMHACGHDAHTAMLLGAAKLLVARRKELPQPVRLIFQPHEEFEPGGAKPMIDAGVLNGVAKIFGLHIWSQLPSGQVGYRIGPAMASPTRFEIVVKGVGGHAAAPEGCVDPILVASHLVTALQSVKSRAIALDEQAVVSVTKFHAGTANNVIPSQAELGGTIRTYDDVVRQRVIQRMQMICDNLGRAWDATIELQLTQGYPALVNDENATQAWLAGAQQIGVTEERLIAMGPQGGGEDFAYFLQQVPGAFFFLGSGSAEKHSTFSHHHPRFDVDESVLSLGSALLAQACFLDSKSQA